MKGLGNVPGLDAPAKQCGRRTSDKGLRLRSFLSARTGAQSVELAHASKLKTMCSVRQNRVLRRRNSARPAQKGARSLSQPRTRLPPCHSSFQSAVNESYSYSRQTRHFALGFLAGLLPCPHAQTQKSTSAALRKPGRDCSPGKNEHASECWLVPQNGGKGEPK